MQLNYIEFKFPDCCNLPYDPVKCSQLYWRSVNLEYEGIPTSAQQPSLIIELMYYLFLVKAQKMLENKQKFHDILIQYLDGRLDRIGLFNQLEDLLAIIYNDLLEIENSPTGLLDFRVNLEPALSFWNIILMIELMIETEQARETNNLELEQMDSKNFDQCIKKLDSEISLFL